MARSIITGKDGNGAEMAATVEDKTLSKITAAKKAGAEIIINTNWQFAGRGYSRTEKLAQTNDRRHGKPKHIIWACYR